MIIRLWHNRPRLGAYTKPEVIAEVVYVLKGVYQINRANICTYIKALLQAVYCEEEPAVSYALDLYVNSALDFVDCLLIAYHKVNKELVFIFDKKMNKYLNNS